MIPFIEKMLFPIKKIYWRKKNKHNLTKMKRNFPTSKVKVGLGSYGYIDAITFDNPDEFVEIGAYCSIAENVTFLMSGQHNYKTLSTYPFKYQCICKGKIILEDDVWIGYGATICSGVHIGRGAIIGAGTVVAKDVPPYAIFANGKIIKYRFEDEIIEKLKKVDYTKLSKEKIQEKMDILYQDIDVTNVDDIIKKLDL